MQIQVFSKGVDVSPALRERLEMRISDSVEKYFNRSGDAHVAISREGAGFCVDCTLHLPTGAVLQVSASAHDAYAAGEAAADRLDKRLRRYKRRLQDRRERGPDEATVVRILQSAGAALEWDTNTDEDEDAPGEPVVVAETSAELPSMTVRMAVWEMDITNAPVLVFRNEDHGGLNVVYRRADGHLGWIDPTRTGDERAS